MVNKMKQAALAATFAAALLGAGGASAATAQSSTALTFDDMIQGNASFGRSFTAGSYTSFDDAYTFVVPTSYTGDASMTSIVSIRLPKRNDNAGNQISLTSITLHSGNPFSGSLIATGSLGTCLGCFFVNTTGQVDNETQALAPGNYYFEIRGNIPVVGGAYGGAAQLALTPQPVTNAIPEPSTYATMFAGLVLLGFTARRRYRNAPAPGQQ